MMGHGRLVIIDERCGEVTGVFSVGANGWVTHWRDDNPEHVAAMYPSTAVLVLIFGEQETEDTDA